MIDIHVGVRWDIESRVEVCGSFINVHVVVKNLPVEETFRRVYYDFPKTTDGLVW